jgi:hypothetical protein
MKITGDRMKKQLFGFIMVLLFAIPYSINAATSTISFAEPEQKEQFVKFIDNLDKEQWDQAEQLAKAVRAKNSELADQFDRLLKISKRYAKPKPSSDMLVPASKIKRKPMIG